MVKILESHWIVRIRFTFFKGKETEKTIKDYEYLLNEKQSTLDNYVQYLDTACELAKIEKVQIIEIVKNNKKSESVTNLLIS